MAVCCCDQPIDLLRWIGFAIRQLKTQLPPNSTSSTFSTTTSPPRLIFSCNLSGNSRLLVIHLL